MNSQPGKKWKNTITKNANKTTAFNDVLLGNQPCEDADHMHQGFVLHLSCVSANVGKNKKLHSQIKKKNVIQSILRNNTNSTNANQREEH